MTAEQVLSSIEAAGGVLALAEGRIRYKLPTAAASLVDVLRANRDAVIRLLERRQEIPPMPPGVRLVHWEPKAAPIVLTRWSVVIDVPAFVRSTLLQLEAALTGRNWLAGNWSAQELVDRLEQVGVDVAVRPGREPPAD